MDQREREALAIWQHSEVGSLRAFWRDHCPPNGPLATLFMWANLRIMSGAIRLWYRWYRRRRGQGK